MVNALEIATVASALSVGLLIALTVVWVRNYRQFRTPLVAALALFGVVLLLENAVAVYFLLFSMEKFYGMDPTVHRWVGALRSMQFLALCALAWATLQ